MKIKLLQISVVLGLFAFAGGCHWFGKDRKFAAQKQVTKNQEIKAKSEKISKVLPRIKRPKKKIELRANGHLEIVSVYPNENVWISWEAQGYERCFSQDFKVISMNNQVLVGKVRRSRKFHLQCVKGAVLTERAVSVQVMRKRKSPVKFWVAADSDDINSSHRDVELEFGTQSLLRWEAPSGAQCYLDGDEEVAPQGSRMLGALTESSSYLLSCEVDGQRYDDSVILRLIKSPLPKVNLKFNGADSAVAQAVGDSMLIEWESEFAESCLLNPGSIIAAQGKYETIVKDQVEYFQLKCEGPGGKIVRNFHLGDEPTNLSLKVGESDSDVVVDYDSSVSIRWEARGVEACKVLGLVKTFSGLKGEETVERIREEKNLSLVCVAKNGKKKQKKLTINVDQAKAPKINLRVNGRADPVVYAGYGDPIIVSWSSSGAKECIVHPRKWRGLTGKKKILTLPETSSFLISCAGSGGSAREVVSVQVKTYDTANCGRNIPCRYQKIDEACRTKPNLEQSKFLEFSSFGRCRNGKISSSKVKIDLADNSALCGIETFEANNQVKFQDRFYLSFNSVLVSSNFRHHFGVLPLRLGLKILDLRRIQKPEAAAAADYLSYCVGTNDGLGRCDVPRSGKWGDLRTELSPATVRRMSAIWKNNFKELTISMHVIDDSRSCELRDYPAIKANQKIEGFLKFNFVNLD